MNNTANPTTRMSAVATSSALISALTQACHAAIAIDLTSWGLSLGDTFQLVMVTNGGTPAISTAITPTLRRLTEVLT